MNSFVVKLILKSVYILDYIFPKKENKIIFYSSPDYDDNCRAMFEKLIELNLQHKYDFVWVVNDLNKYKKFIKNAKVVKHRSLRSLYNFLTSKYIIRTHSFWGNVYIPKRQIMCVAWHGMLIKGYHYSEIGIYPHNAHDYFCVTSPLFQKLFAKMFNADLNRFNITGFPRNDYLFQTRRELLTKLHINGYKKRIIWMPTFREYDNGLDGVSSKYGLPTLQEGDLNVLDNYLKEHNYCLILKLHPWALEKVDIGRCSNILLIKNSDVPIEYSIYHLIGAMDAMISDYSSVWGDFLLLDRPIGFAYDDLAEYEKSRFIPLSPIENYMPGMRINGLEDLLLFLDSLESEDNYKNERKRIRKLFLSHADGDSSKRFLKEIGLLK